MIRYQSQIRTASVSNRMCLWVRHGKYLCAPIHGSSGSANIGEPQRFDAGFRNVLSNQPCSSQQYEEVDSRYNRRIAWLERQAETSCRPYLHYPDDSKGSRSRLRLKTVAGGGHARNTAVRIRRESVVWVP